MMQPKHFEWRLEGKVGVITLNRPERKNPLTFESYGELRDVFRSLQHQKSVKTVVATSAKSGTDAARVSCSRTAGSAPGVLASSTATRRPSSFRAPTVAVANTETCCAT